MANGHGGSRAGAGRRPGSKTERTREVADRIMAEGVTPLEVMLDVMRRHYAAERFDQAAGVAKDCAPYCHPRLNATDLNVAGGLALQIVEDIVDGDQPRSPGDPDPDGPTPPGPG